MTNNNRERDKEKEREGGRRERERVARTRLQKNAFNSEKKEKLLGLRVARGKPIVTEHGIRKEFERAELQLRPRGKSILCVLILEST